MNSIQKSPITKIFVGCKLSPNSSQTSFWYTVANAVADKTPESEPQISRLKDVEGDFPSQRCFPPESTVSSSQYEQSDTTRGKCREKRLDPLCEQPPKIVN